MEATVQVREAKALKTRSQRVGKHAGERSPHALDIERLDDQLPVFELAVPEETAELFLVWLLPMRGLLLEGAEPA
jgi:hypothetical protein